MRFPALAAILAAGCDSEFFHRNKDAPPGDDGGDADADADSDADADADSDADTDGDADTDADTDTGPTDGLDCDEDYATPPPGSSPLGTCITEEIGCGDVLYGTLEGGSSVYTYDFWDGEGATGSILGNTDALDGEERCYAFLDLAQGETATVRVTTCFDGFVTWIRMGDVGGGFCSLDSFNVGGIFAPDGNGGFEYDMLNVSASDGYDFEFQIEGIDGAVGNYEISLECP